MSTIAEHLATLEMYRSMGRRGDDFFYQEAYMFTQVHWKELIGLIEPAEFTAAREQVESRMRDQHPQQAEEILAKWKDAMIAAPDAGGV